MQTLFEIKNVLRIIRTVPLCYPKERRSEIVVTHSVYTYPMELI